MFRVASELLDRWLLEHPGARVRLLGVGVSALSEDNQLGLFETGPGHSPLKAAVADIRDRYGDEAVQTDGRIPDGDGIQGRRS
jgi:hypothetical protein